MDREPTYAFGIELRLTPRADGGRLTALLGGNASDRRFKYRPNWGLPGMIPPEQTGAPVLAFSREHIAPGEACRAVIVAMFPNQVPLWAAVTDGTDLPMYEGTRVCGVGHVVWRAETNLPVPDEDESRDPWSTALFMMALGKAEWWAYRSVTVHPGSRVGVAHCWSVRRDPVSAQACQAT